MPPPPVGDNGSSHFIYQKTHASTFSVCSDAAEGTEEEEQEDQQATWRFRFIVQCEHAPHLATPAQDMS